MKHSKSEVRCKFTCLPQLRFDDQQLSSFSGLIVFQQLITDLDLKRRLSRCFEHQKGSPSFSTTSIVLVLIVSVLLGYRRLRDVQFFKDDPVVLHLLGLRCMPTVFTINRLLSTVDDRSIRGLERLQQNLVIEAPVRERLSTITLDFDGSVLGTCRHAERVANGFNKKKNGQRSYYPLQCTVAQAAKALAVHHRMLFRALFQQVFFRLKHLGSRLVCRFGTYIGLRRDMSGGSYPRCFVILKA